MDVFEEVLILYHLHKQNKDKYIRFSFSKTTIQHYLHMLKKGTTTGFH